MGARKHRWTKYDRLEPFRRELRAIFEREVERYGYEKARRLWMKAIKNHDPNRAPADCLSDEALARAQRTNPELFTDTMIEAIKLARRPLS